MHAFLSRVLSFFHNRTGAQSTGARGEKAAAAFLKSKGYTIIALNWRSPKDRRDELDLVARDGETLVFIEVKTRAAGALVKGYHTVNARKKKVLRRAADTYMRGLPGSARPTTMRFDIVEVSHASDDILTEINHFENISLFGKHYGEF